MAKKCSEIILGTEKEFMNVFTGLCHSRNYWDVWADVISVIACSLSNAADRSPEHYGKREEEYLHREYDYQSCDRACVISAGKGWAGIVVYADVPVGCVAMEENI